MTTTTTEPATNASPCHDVKPGLRLLLDPPTLVRAVTGWDRTRIEADITGTHRESGGLTVRAVRRGVLTTTPQGDTLTTWAMAWRELDTIATPARRSRLAGAAAAHAARPGDATEQALQRAIDGLWNPLSDSWRDRAACIGEPVDLFFPDSRHGGSYTTAARVIGHLCRPCPVRAECLADDELTSRSRRCGIRGGTYWRYGVPVTWEDGPCGSLRGARQHLLTGEEMCGRCTAVSARYA